MKLIIILLLLFLIPPANAITLSNITNTTPMATTVWVEFDIDICSNNTIEYSIHSDMSNSNYTLWNNNTTSIQQKIWYLKPTTKYYIRLHSYNFSNNCDNTTHDMNITTDSCISTVNVNTATSSITQIDSPIQEALDKMSFGNGGTVNIDDGYYYIPLTMRIAKNNILLQGTNKNNVTIEGNTSMTLIYAYGPNATFPDPYAGPFPDAPPNSLYIENITVSDMSLKGNAIAGDANELIDTTGEGVSMHECWKVNVINVSMETMEANAVRMSYTDNFLISNCNGYDTACGVTSRQSVTGTIINCVFDKCANHGIALKGTSTYMTIENTTISDCYLAGMYAYGTKNAIWRNNTVYDNRYAVDLASGSTNNTFENNIFRNNNYGVLLSSRFYTGSHTIRNNLIYDNSYEGIKCYQGDAMMNPQTLIIESNTVVNNGDDGVYNSAQDLTMVLKNNIVSDNGGYGIFNDSSHITSSYNNAWNNTLGNYNNSESATDISVNPMYYNQTGRLYHLNSTIGTWNGTGWKIMSQDSPCIDAGNTTSDYSNEPEPNGNIINMGVYGNTIHASKSSWAVGNCIYVGWSQNTYQNGDIIQHGSVPQTAASLNGIFSMVII